MGFAWAFLHAGARAVVAGLWDVSDGATGPLMSKFYEGIAAGEDAATALHAAKLAMLKNGAHRKTVLLGRLPGILRHIRPPIARLRKLISSRR